MWICPKCGRAFQRTNQGHYCGKAPQTVIEYIESQPAETQSHLTTLATIIRNTIPDIQEGISWSMPTYKKEGKSISFSACKQHVSLYVGNDAIEHFASELGTYITKKSAIYLPYNKPLPSTLIEELVIWCFL